MRPRASVIIASGPLRRLFVLSLTILGVLCGLGCAGKAANDDGGKQRDDMVEVKGVVSSRGSTPFPLLMLEATNGTTYVLESSDVAHELQQLEGMQIAVTGSIKPDVGGDTPYILVYDYWLLRLPSGEQPVVGTIRAMTGELGEVIVLMYGDAMWIIEGEFKSVLQEFNGSRVWIVGVPKEKIHNSYGTFHSILVTEYGVLSR